MKTQPQVLEQLAKDQMEHNEAYWDARLKNEDEEPRCTKCGGSVLGDTDGLCSMCV